MECLVHLNRLECNIYVDFYIGVQKIADTFEVPGIVLPKKWSSANSCTLTDIYIFWMLDN